MSRKRVVAVGQLPQVSGFALAGVPVVEADARADAASKLADVLAMTDSGVVLADQDVIDALSEPVRRRMARLSVPILLALPNPNWSATAVHAGDCIVDLLQHAIGYRVRLR